MKCRLLFLLLLIFLSNYSHGQQAYSPLPDAFTFSDGKKVTNAKQWDARREELLKVFRSEMYGTSPPRPGDMRFEVFDQENNALGGKATRKQITIHIKENGREAKFDLLVYIPNKARHPVPAIIGLNFIGNRHEDQVGHELDYVARSKVLSGLLVVLFVEPPDQLLKNRSHGMIIETRQPYTAIMV